MERKRKHIFDKPKSESEALTVEQVEAMDYNAMKSKVVELDLEVADNKTETLKAALIHSIEAKVQ